MISARNASSLLIRNGSSQKQRRYLQCQHHSFHLDECSSLREHLKHAFHFRFRQPYFSFGMQQATGQTATVRTRRGTSPRFLMVRACSRCTSSVSIAFTSSRKLIGRSQRSCCQTSTDPGSAGSDKGGCHYDGNPPSCVNASRRSLRYLRQRSSSTCLSGICTTYTPDL